MKSWPDHNYHVSETPPAVRRKRRDNVHQPGLSGGPRPRDRAGPLLTVATLGSSPPV